MSAVRLCLYTAILNSSCSSGISCHIRFVLPLGLSRWLTALIPNVYRFFWSSMMNWWHHHPTLAISTSDLASSPSGGHEWPLPLVHSHILPHFFVSWHHLHFAVGSHPFLSTSDSLQDFVSPCSDVRWHEKRFAFFRFEMFPIVARILRNRVDLHKMLDALPPLWKDFTKLMRRSNRVTNDPILLFNKCNNYFFNL